MAATLNCIWCVVNPYVYGAFLLENLFPFVERPVLVQVYMR
jgi:hypothetical protein